MTRGFKNLWTSGVKISILVLILSFSVFFTGCSKVDTLKVKLGIKNNDFEYIKDAKIQKVIIQNTRDKSFRFIVTDKKVIEEIYDILSTAKRTESKTSLESDYIFEMYESDTKCYKFNYVAGVDKKEAGNFYNDNNIYIVSKRIDTDIIQSLWKIRKPPKDFKNVYYSSILETLDEYIKNNKDIKDKKIGINIKGDIEAARFILSTDLETFKFKLKNKYSNVELIENNEENFDITMTIKTEGYKSTLYKGVVTIWNKKEKIEAKYYIWDDLINNRWNTRVTDSKPKDF